MPRHASGRVTATELEPSSLRRIVCGWLKLLSVLVLFPALLLAGPAPVNAFRCDIAQITRTACCCPAAEVPNGPALSRECCCERLQVEAAVAAGSPHEERSCVMALDRVIVQLAARLKAPTAFGDISRRGHASPTDPKRSRAGPSLILLHRRFLI